MAVCEAQTFGGITQTRFDCLVQQAQTAGITITGNVGAATKNGVIIRWEFDSVNQTLELQCTGLPFFLSCETINGKIHDLVDACP
jgi:hypothetical protein